MPHVMVPVPEEHLAEFSVGLMRITMGMAGWDDAKVAAFVADLEGDARNLVLAVASASVDHERVPYRALGARLGLDVADVMDLVATVNDRCRRAGSPMPLMTDTREGTSPEGEPTATPVVTIVRQVAQKVIAAAATASPPPDPA